MVAAVRSCREPFVLHGQLPPNHHSFSTPDASLTLSGSSNVIGYELLRPPTPSPETLTHTSCRFCGRRLDWRSWADFSSVWYRSNMMRFVNTGGLTIGAQIKVVYWVAGSGFRKASLRSGLWTLDSTPHAVVAVSQVRVSPPPLHQNPRTCPSIPR